jgi:hypothetical protein
VSQILKHSTAPEPCLERTADQTRVWPSCCLRGETAGMHNAYINLMFWGCGLILCDLDFRSGHLRPSQRRLVTNWHGVARQDSVERTDKTSDSGVNNAIRVAGVWSGWWPRATGTMHARTGHLHVWCEHAEHLEEKASWHAMRPSSLGLTLQLQYLMVSVYSFIIFM